MISIERMRAVESNSKWRGVPPRVLMENAGAGLAREIRKRAPSYEKVSVFAGTGNNGGDGLVTGRHLINSGADLEVVLLGKPQNIPDGPAMRNWETLSEMDHNVNFHIIRDSTEIKELELDKPSVAVDAMLGIGVKGKPREPISSAIDYINGLESYVAAVDIPTGVDPVRGKTSGKATKCDLTVTFHKSKRGLENVPKEYLGELVTLDIGIPKAAEEMAGPGDVQQALPPRKMNSHKGENGRVLVIGGSSEFTGAPALSGLSALNTGADLVEILAPKRTAEVISSYSPDIITHKFEGENLNDKGVERIRNELGKFGAVIIGPGLGLKQETQEATAKIMNLIRKQKTKLPVLFDADGLKISADNKNILSELECLITPHSGEFEILTGKKPGGSLEEKKKSVSKTSSDLEISILLKSPVDICAGPNGEITLNDTGNPGMTAGGTGDVLCGIAGAMMSLGATPYRSAVAASFLSGLAGDLCRNEKGYEFTASDVKDRIPNSIEKVREFW
ncbi:MAG: NAD(P)H-hydrate dehydratase [Candidatus Hadarchaeia archaeon]